jgi:glycosyltransferase involved in cell wall biosynthesis
MRVLIVNTSEKTGGAAIAASRLKDALINNGIKAKMLVRKKETDNLSVVGLRPSWHLRYNFLKERFNIWLTNGMKRQHLFDIDTATHGTDITSLPEFKEADVVHLHWVNQGMLSLRDIQKIVASGKPIVWTMHDMWPFTGICHYSRECHNYITGCHNCPLLVHPKAHDLSYKIFNRKERLYGGAKIEFVACSRWLADQARQSRLLRGQRINDIPNAISTVTFKPRDKEKAREQCRLPLDKKLILFSAFRTTSPIKGLKYFIDACNIFNERHPEMKEQVAIVAVGKDADTITGSFPYPVYSLGYIEDEHLMARIYNACDVFVIPSLQDNLPNTIVEAMASGVPCVASAVGGIPQMVNHLEDGYLAEPRQAADFAKGLEWLLTQCNYNTVSAAARTYAVNEYSEHNVAMRYIEIYNSICNKYYE